MSIDHCNFRPEKAIWHGALPTGEPADQKCCNSWATNDTGEKGLASSLLQPKILATEEFKCSSRLIVLCIETTPALPEKIGRRRRSVVENVDDFTPEEYEDALDSLPTPNEHKQNLILQP